MFTKKIKLGAACLHTYNILYSVAYLVARNEVRTAVCSGSYFFLHESLFRSFLQWDFVILNLKGNSTRQPSEQTIFHCKAFTPRIHH
jgi:hypothetical protein